MKNVTRFAAVLATATSMCVLVYAQRSTSLTLKPGVAKSIAAEVKGKAYVDYRVRLGAGQSLTVSLQSKSTAVYFNCIPPKSVAAMHIGSMGSHKMVRTVPVEGEYTVRVYQMGAAASEGKRNSFAVHLKAGGKALKPISGAIDAKLKGTPYHAKTIAPCKHYLKPGVTTCDAYVIRREGGAATVEFRVGQMIRRVLFKDGKPVAHDYSFSFSYEREGDQTKLRFGEGPEEEYTVVDALIYGG